MRKTFATDQHVAIEAVATPGAGIGHNNPPPEIERDDVLIGGEATSTCAQVHRALPVSAIAADRQAHVGAKVGRCPLRRRQKVTIRNGVAQALRQAF